MKYYTIHHHTRYRYETPVSESMMEVRMKPRSDQRQHCLNFQLDVLPEVQILSTADYLQNEIHYFNIPRRHSELILRSKSLVMVQDMQPQAEALDSAEWDKLAEIAASGRYWDWLSPSRFAHPTELLSAFAAEIGADTICCHTPNGTPIYLSNDPLHTLHQLNDHIHRAFEYIPTSTSVDSAIDIPLQKRRGVCQDFSHVMIALLRGLGIPARYISGYLFHTKEENEGASNASHAWVEAYLPSMGWVGLDPTNNTRVQERHIRIAIGRDYADVPPTKGIYKGDVRGELSVGVHISQTDDASIPKDLLEAAQPWTATKEREEQENSSLQQKQQQQQ